MKTPAKRLSGTSGPSVPRKPRLMVAGEFSAGKTCLINGLLGDRVLPSNVTATALPPIWLVSGNGPRLAVDLDGKTREIAALSEVQVEDTQYCVIPHGAELLQRYDIIDTPGNSDPNIPSESWERMLDYADAVIWCTNATQAWRQSEKSVWNEMPERLLKSATLLITHADRITDGRSAEKLLRRVRREADKYFQSVLIASLLDSDHLSEVGAYLDAVMADLDSLDGAPSPLVGDRVESIARPKQELAHPVAPRRVVSRSRDIDPPPEAKGAHDTTRTSEAQSGDVLVLQLSDSAPAAVEKRDASARTLWEALSRKVDMTDAVAVRECVEDLLAALDEWGEPREDRLYGEDGHTADGLNQRVTSRRGS